MGGKVDNALNEARTLVLVVQVLLGFRLQAVFQSGFDRLPTTAQNAHLVGLGLETVALALLLWPAARHRIVEEGRDTAGFHHFVTGVMTVALLPVALGLGLDRGRVRAAAGGLKDVHLAALPRPAGAHQALSTATGNGRRGVGADFVTGVGRGLALLCANQGVQSTRRSGRQRAAVAARCRR